MQCPQCKTDNPDESVFCAKCGTQLKGTEEKPLPTQTIEAPKEELKTGSTFAGRYQIIEELGKGGMGKVYRALDKKLNEEVALKLIKSEISSDKKTLERFQNELKIARKISHRNVGRMYELLEDEGTGFITMEYVPGQDLKSLIRQTGQLTTGTSISIAKQVCDGLSEAHSLGVVHRDLKPSNIMIDKNGNARIMDFGIACSLKGRGITDKGIMIGTPDYMSPEQVEGKEIDQRTDIYSLGVILYEMVTGRLPFEGETVLSIAHKHKFETPKEPKTLNPQIPEELSRIVLKCLEKDKARRYQRIEGLRSDLTRVEEELSTTMRRPAEKEFKTPTTTQERWGNSIAVLPFVNMSADPEQEYFCDGIAEELINALTQIKDLRVVARTSTFSFKGKDTDIEEIGKKLKVNKVLEGSVRKVGNRLRITAQLINVEDGYHLWSERYDRDLDDVFAIQDEVTLAIVDHMKVKLLGKEKQKLTKRSTDNAEAYQFYLKGRYFWHKRTSKGYQKAVEFYNKAIEIDMEFALSYVGLASVYVSLGFFGLLRPKDVFPKAKSLCEKALKIDKNLTPAQMGLSDVSLYYDWDWPAAERGYRKAIELNPGDAFSYWRYALYLGFMGRFNEAIREMKKAVNLDPLSPLFNSDMASIHRFARRYNESIEWFQKSLELEPNYGYAVYEMGLTYARQKKYKEAEKNLQDAVRLTGGLPWAIGWLSYVYSKLGKRKKAESLLQELLNRSQKGYLPPSCLVAVYSGFGDFDKVVDCWNDAYEEREPILCTIKVLPELDPYRSNPRFEELLEKMNLI